MLLAIAIPSSASAATIIRASVSGKIDTGTDVSGLFRPVNSDLAGTPYTLTVYSRIKDVQWFGNDQFFRGYRCNIFIRGKILANLDSSCYYGLNENGEELGIRQKTPDGSLSAGGRYLFYYEGKDRTPINFVHNSIRFASGIGKFETDYLGPDPIPEPSAWALMLVGFLAVGAGLRRARRSAVPASSAGLPVLLEYGVAP